MYSVNKINVNSAAVQWVKNKTNQREVVNKFANLDIFKSVKNPNTILMAGCTGSGKTEFSKRLLTLTEKLKNVERYVRTYADEFYVYLKKIFNLKGDFRSELNFPCIKLVEILADHAIHKDQNLLIDSTFSHEKSLDNIRRSLKHGRGVHVYFIYEKPKVAWNYVVKREKIEGRIVPKEFFISSYLGSINIVREAIREFGNKIIIDVFQKSGKVDLNTLFPNFENICRVENINDFDIIINEEYNYEILEKLIF